jgi:hypothetical protein
MPIVEEIYSDHYINEDEINELDIKRAAKNLAVGAALGAATMFGSPKASAQVQPHQTTSVSTSNKAIENQIEKILIGNYGKTWEGRKNSNNIKFTFSKENNKMWIKFNDEESYIGKWKLSGNKLTIINTDLNTTEVLPIKAIDKNNIMIGNNKFSYSVDPVD